MILPFFLPLLAFSLACEQRNGQVCIQVYNKCSFPIWPGIQGQKHTPSPSGFHLPAGAIRDLYVPEGWKAARIWARTGCDERMRCATGGCGNEEDCRGRGGEPPASLVEFTLHGNGAQDYYDVSLVDGYNLPVFIEPLEGTYDTNQNSQFYCKKAGGCFKDLNDPAICPKELRKNINGRIVACKSACLAFKTDQYCCRGAHSTPQTCRSTDWPRNYPAIFKDACPTAYSYAYDDHTSTFTCRGRGRQSPDYRVQFC